MDTAFKMYRRFNDEALRGLTGVRARLEPGAEAYFAGDGLPERLARALARRRAIPIKELFESAEFFARVRRRVRAPHVADLCCGHGLTGALFAVFERQVEAVTLLDLSRPESHDAVLDALDEVAPWARAKLRFVEEDVARAASLLPPGAGVVAVHACGVRTDRALEAAIAVGGAAAVMPCCYIRTARAAPRAVRDALGAGLATDIHRTYQLEEAGYVVDWSQVPGEITDKNRVLVAWRPRRG